ncbi:uncharacterized protein RAG0_07735 [Rhynchosporium agropyri]|uniref:Uncharacterized protein n=1 Tax=Rhynchosporium agropyri TaxID=914238 RepID=A0A1E1KN35_9HELO|nr:uncharacterized protein RAG0_07735 [Rhynchosporium agropyri]
MTPLLPRYLDIRREGYLSPVRMPVMQYALEIHSRIPTNSRPTYLSSLFLSYLSLRYAQFEDLHSAAYTGPYHFTFGCRWENFTAYNAGILINVVGLVGVIKGMVPVLNLSTTQNSSAKGFIVARSVNCLLCKFFPVSPTDDAWLEVGDQVECIEAGGKELISGVLLGRPRRETLRYK